MLILILFLVIGSVLAYVSRYNLTPVTVNVGPYAFSSIPLFYVIVGSVITGLVLSYIIYMVHAIATSFTLRDKDHTIKKEKNEILELTKHVHQLELENEKLKHTPHIEPRDRNAL